MTDFKGFPRELPQFFSDLESNNTRDWFQARKKEYETHVKAPSAAFVNAMGQRLADITPEINAIPKINQSMFRLNRDTRFSKDKRPYKTNLGILFWIGPGKRMERPGFYFHLEPGMLMLGSGFYRFTKQAMALFRDAVVDPGKGKALEAVVRDLEMPPYEIGTRHYKRIPRGYEAKNEFQAEFLRYNGLSARIELDIPDVLFSEAILDLCFDHFREMAPLSLWLNEVIPA